jgi:hypothetical protein
VHGTFPVVGRFESRVQLGSSQLVADLVGGDAHRSGLVVGRGSGKHKTSTTRTTTI